MDFCLPTLVILLLLINYCYSAINSNVSTLDIVFLIMYLMGLMREYVARRNFS